MSFNSLKRVSARCLGFVVVPVVSNLLEALLPLPTLPPPLLPLLLPRLILILPLPQLLLPQLALQCSCVDGNPSTTQKSRGATLQSGISFWDQKLCTSTALWLFSCHDDGIQTRIECRNKEWK